MWFGDRERDGSPVERRNEPLIFACRVRTFGTDAHFVLRVVLEETLDTPAGELDVGSLSVTPRSILWRLSPIRRVIMLLGDPEC